MRIVYRTPDEYKPVDISKLRPKGSYGKLIAKRTFAIDDLVAKFGRIPAELLIERRCPTCRADNHAAEMEKDHMAIVRCRSCDTVFVNPVFDEAHYDRIYRSSNYQQIVRDLGEASHEYRVARFGNERVDIMSRFVRPAAGQPVSYLDIGCSTGFVVEAAQKRGWAASGVDLNPSAIQFGKQRGLNLSNIAIAEAPIAKGSLDAVSLFDVLEHVFDPMDFLRQARDLLKIGGVVFLYVPNYDSASRLMMGKKAHFIWPAHHLTYFTPKTITDFVTRLDFEVDYLATEGLDLADYLWYQSEVADKPTDALEPIADQLQFFINAGGYGKNLRVLARRLK